MKFKSAFGSCSVLFISLPLACGGTAIDGGGDGDGDGGRRGPPLSDPGDGDGDSAVGAGASIGGGTSSGSTPGMGGGISVGGTPGIGGYPTMGGYPGAGGGFAGSPGTVQEPLVGCQTVNDYSDVNFCQVYQECENGWLNTYCESYDGRNICSCENNGRYIQLEVANSKVGESCRQVAPICQDFPAAAPDVPEVCSPTYSEAGQGYCTLSEECRRTFDANGVKVSALRASNVWCGDGSCQCDSNARIELPSSAATASTCSSARDLCDSQAIAPTGMGVCSPRYQSANRDYCEVELECAHTATLAGQTVNVFNSTYANCQISGANSYTCSCQNGTDPFVVASDSGWNACSELATLCSF